MQFFKHSISGNENRLLCKIKPWEAGRPQAEGSNPVVPDKPPAVHLQPSHHPVPHSVSHKSTTSAAPVCDRYQRRMLAVITIICLLAAISALTYVFNHQEPPAQNEIHISSLSSVASSVQASASSSASRRAVTTKKSASASSSVQTVATSETSSSAISQESSSSAISQAIQQVPSTRVEQRKLLKAIQDARRARQEEAANSAPQ